MAKVTQTKDKDFDAIEPRVSFNDMPEERFTKIVQACRDAYSKSCAGIPPLPHLASVFFSGRTGSSLEKNEKSICVA